jgi:hypothetical protein
MLYEQARVRGRNTPWPDAADLTSYLAAEKVDAIVARGMKTVWVDPVYSVEAWGSAAARAPFVEEFHQWKVEEERLQNVLDRLWQISLVEPRGLLEVYEGTEYRVVRRQMNAAVQIDPMSGTPVYGEDGQPQLQMGPDGKFVEAQDGQEQMAVTVVDDPQPVRCGPCYRIIPYRDSVILPGSCTRPAGDLGLREADLEAAAGHSAAEHGPDGALRQRGRGEDDEHGQSGADRRPETSGTGCRAPT